MVESSEITPILQKRNHTCLLIQHYHCSSLSTRLFYSSSKFATSHKALYWHVKESEDIRRAMVPLDLIRRVREIRQDVNVETEQIQQKDVKQTAAVDLISRLNNFRSNSDAGSIRALEEWRKRKMERARQRSLVKNGTASSQK